jgi:hypothetical protein
MFVYLYLKQKRLIPIYSWLSTSSTIFLFAAVFVWAIGGHFALDSMLEAMNVDGSFEFPLYLSSSWYLLLISALLSIFVSISIWYTCMLELSNSVDFDGKPAPSDSTIEIDQLDGEHEHEHAPHNSTQIVAGGTDPFRT